MLVPWVLMDATGDAIAGLSHDTATAERVPVDMTALLTSLRCSFDGVHYR